MMNFNDFLASLITLFHLMVVNNWFNTTNMLCAITGNNWPRIYTFSFIIITVWIMFSVVISTVLETQSHVSEDVEKEWNRRRWVKNLRNSVEANNLQPEQIAELRRRGSPRENSGESPFLINMTSDLKPTKS
jgi:hypothetical protein